MTFQPLLPLDEHNSFLQSQVHPPDWQNPSPKSKYHLVVIGAGTGGLVTAAIAANLGANVALIERELMGGDCLNVGCVPSKALIRPARSIYEAQRGISEGLISEADIKPDFEAIMERMRRLRSKMSKHDSVQRFSEMGIDVFLGEGQFESNDTISVRDSQLRFSKAVVATGARAWIPPIEGLSDCKPLTNETVFSLTSLPNRLVVIGAGPIGCELSQTFHRFGSKVTMINNAERILPNEPVDASHILERQFEQEGIIVHNDCSVKQVQTDGAIKKIQIESGKQSKQLEIEADEILIGAGRTPNVGTLNLSSVGVEFDDRNGIKVNDRLQSTNSNIYAVGDVCSRFKFTHAADAMARIVVQNALFFGRKRFSNVVIPWCTYTDPEIAGVGLSERELKERGVEYESVRVEMNSVDRAILDGDDEGYLEFRVNPKGTIYGATMVSSHAGESISEIALALTQGLKMSDLSSTVHPYPTQAEAIRKAGDLFQKKKLTPMVKKVLTWILKLR